MTTVGRLIELLSGYDQNQKVGFSGADGTEYEVLSVYEDKAEPPTVWIDLGEDTESPTNGLLAGPNGFVPSGVERL